MTDLALSQDIHDYFHLFWDRFPFPVMMIRKDRTILDRNPAAEAIGCVPGMRCINLGPKEAHKGCLANFALRDKTAKSKFEYVECLNAVLNVFWIPLLDDEEVFIHFNIDITEHAAERYFKDGAPQVREGAPQMCV